MKTWMIWVFRTVITVIVMMVCAAISWVFGTDFSVRGSSLGTTCVFTVIFGFFTFFLPPWMDLRKKW